ncbi:hypothetical protein B9Z55_014969 [Caenorhabditis nigoni]|nr:hypothetical protein B9Z55_014969 [Caenorhabditis nigoni]
MVTRMSGVLRTSDSTGSVASNGSTTHDASQIAGTSSQPTSPAAEGAILTTMIATRNLSSKFSCEIFKSFQ